MKQIILIAHNLRSAHNIGSLLRTADGHGVDTVIFTGYTPYPIADGDSRMPHEAAKVSQQIHKTALGAENTVRWEYKKDIIPVLNRLKKEHYVLGALEQSHGSISLPTYRAPTKIALCIGNEVDGLEKEILDIMDVILEIPMAGKKESYNVTQAAAMALYHLNYC